jgi:hypothetical protein
MNEQPDFIKLRLDGPYEKETVTVGYILLFVSILSIFECLTILKIDEFDFYGFKFNDVSSNLVIIIFLIAVAILSVIFQSKAVSNYFNWRREVQKADNNIKLEHRKKGRGMVKKWMDDIMIKQDSMTLPEEDIKDLLT